MYYPIVYSPDLKQLSRQSRIEIANRIIGRHFTAVEISSLFKTFAIIRNGDRPSYDRADLITMVDRITTGRERVQAKTALMICTPLWPNLAKYKGVLCTPVQDRYNWSNSSGNYDLLLFILDCLRVHFSISSETSIVFTLNSGAFEMPTKEQLYCSCFNGIDIYLAKSEVLLYQELIPKQFTTEYKSWFKKFGFYLKEVFCIG